MTFGELGSLRIGRYHLEGDVVGSVSFRKMDNSLEVTLLFNLSELQAALMSTGLYPSDDERERVRRVEAAIEDASNDFGTWHREWLTRTLLSNREIANQSVADFLRWAETVSTDLDLWLGVPAVRAKIRQIQTEGSTTVKRRLAKVIAGIADGRPQRLPHERVLYVEVREAEAAVRSLHAVLMASRNRESVWRAVQTDHPAVAEHLERSGLRARWFSNSRQLSSLQMACDVVANRHRSTARTIERLTGSIRAARERKPPQIDRAAIAWTHAELDRELDEAVGGPPKRRARRAAKPK